MGASWKTQFSVFSHQLSVWRGELMAGGPILASRLLAFSTSERLLPRGPALLPADRLFGRVRSARCERFREPSRPDPFPRSARPSLHEGGHPDQPPATTQLSLETSLCELRPSIQIPADKWRGAR